MTRLNNAVTSAMVDGKPVTIGLNAHIKPCGGARLLRFHIAKECCLR